LSMQISRGLIPDEHVVFDLEAILKEVVEYTHYLPDEWRAKLHANEVYSSLSHYESYVVSYIHGES
jgi:autophagy-related protein 9